MTCSIPECKEEAVCSAFISIDGKPKQLLPVCQIHADAAQEDVVVPAGLTCEQKLGIKKDQTHEE